MIGIITLFILNPMPKKSITIKQIIIDTLGEAFFMPLLFLLAVNALKEKMDTLSDDEAKKLFGNLYEVKFMRKLVTRIHTKMNRENINLL